jgi:hypothetical protein
MKNKIKKIAQTKKRVQTPPLVTAALLPQKLRYIQLRLFRRKKPLKVAITAL